MLNQFCVAQNLRSMICEKLPPDLSDIKDAFLSTFDDSTYGNLLHDTSLFSSWSTQYTSAQYQNTETSTKLDDDLYLLLKSAYQYAAPYALCQQSIIFQGLNFSTIQNSPRDSYVIHGDLSAGNWCASYITAIVVYLREHTGDKEDRVLVVLDSYEMLTAAEVVQDPFHRRWPDYPDVVGRLFKKSISGRKTAADLRDVVCHYAHTPMTVPQISGECIHALPLDRVSKISFVNIITC
jgi:hypothetical protein